MICKNELIKMLFSEAREEKPSYNKKELNDFFDIICAPSDLKLYAIGNVVHGFLDILIYYLNTQSLIKHEILVSNKIICEDIIQAFDKRKIFYLHTNNIDKLNKNNTRTTLNGYNKEYPEYCMLALEVADLNDSLNYSASFTAIKAHMFQVMKEGRSFKYNKKRCSVITAAVRSLGGIIPLNDNDASKSRAVSKQLALSLLKHNPINQDDFYVHIQDVKNKLRKGSTGRVLITKIEGFIDNRVIHIIDNDNAQHRRGGNRRCSNYGGAVYRMPENIDLSHAELFEYVVDENEADDESLHIDIPPFENNVNTVRLIETKGDNTRSGIYFEKQGRLKAERKFNHIEMASNRVTFHTDRLSLYDIHVFLHELDKFNKGNLGYNRLKIYLLIRLLFGIHIGEDIAQDIKKEKKYLNIKVNMKNNTIGIYVNFKQHVVTPVSDKQDIAIKISKYMYMPMPSFLCSLINELYPDSSQCLSLNDILQLDKNTYKSSGEKLLSNINIKNGARLTLGRITRYMPDAVVANPMGGDIMAAFINGAVKFGCENPITYRAMTDNKIISVYNNIFDLISKKGDCEDYLKIKFNNKKKDVWLGAKNIIKQVIFKKIVSKLKYRCKVATKDKHYIEQHNEFTVYCATMLITLTLHRATSNLLPLITDFNPDSNSLFKMDKGDNTENGGVIVDLPKVLVNQLSCYFSYIPNLQSYCKENNQKIYQQIKNHGVFDEMHLSRSERINIINSDNNHTFFLIDENNETRKIKSKDIEDRIMKYLPSRIYDIRGSMGSRLYNMGCPEKSINYIMGHYLQGGKDSNILSFKNPEVQGRIITPFIDTIITEDGWSVIKAPIL